jgi:hypothetical protein
MRIIKRSFTSPIPMPHRCNSSTTRKEVSSFGIDPKPLIITKGAEKSDRYKR